MVARHGDTLLDDVFGSVLLLGKTENGDVTVRCRDGQIIDRTPGHLQCCGGKKTVVRPEDSSS
eukprot:1752013-Pleurochrysis_carterae.AAC.1